MTVSWPPYLIPPIGCSIPAVGPLLACTGPVVGGQRVRGVGGGFGVRTRSEAEAWQEKPIARCVRVHSVLEVPGGGLDQAPEKRRGQGKQSQEKASQGKQSQEKAGVSSHRPGRGKMRDAQWLSDPRGGQHLRETLGKGYRRGSCLLGAGQVGKRVRERDRNLPKVSWPTGMCGPAMVNNLFPCSLYHAFPCHGGLYFLKP